MDRTFTAVVLRPNVIDAHDHIYNEDVVKDACYDFNEFCKNASVLEHYVEASPEDVAVVESFIAPTDYEVNGQDVLKGDWVMTTRINNDVIWEECLKGTFKAYSVGCSGSLVDMEDIDD